MEDQSLIEAVQYLFCYVLFISFARKHPCDEFPPRIDNICTFDIINNNSLTNFMYMQWFWSSHLLLTSPEFNFYYPFLSTRIYDKIYCLDTYFNLKNVLRKEDYLTYLPSFTTLYLEYIKIPPALKYTTYNISDELFQYLDDYTARSPSIYPPYLNKLAAELIPKSAYKLFQITGNLIPIVPMVIIFNEIAPRPIPLYLFDYTVLWGFNKERLRFDIKSTDYINNINYNISTIWWTYLKFVENSFKKYSDIGSYWVYHKLKFHPLNFVERFCYNFFYFKIWENLPEVTIAEEGYLDVRYPRFAPPGTDYKIINFYDIAIIAWVIIYIGWFHICVPRDYWSDIWGGLEPIYDMSAKARWEDFIYDKDSRWIWGEEKLPGGLEGTVPFDEFVHGRFAYVIKVHPEGIPKYEFHWNLFPEISIEPINWNINWIEILDNESVLELRKTMDHNLFEWDRVWPELPHYSFNIRDRVFNVLFIGEFYRKLPLLYIPKYRAAFEIFLTTLDGTLYGNMPIFDWPNPLPGWLDNYLLPQIDVSAAFEYEPCIYGYKPNFYPAPDQFCKIEKEPPIYQISWSNWFKDLFTKMHWYNYFNTKYYKICAYFGW